MGTNLSKRERLNLAGSYLFKLSSYLIDSKIAISILSFFSRPINLSDLN
jgi:hypothetical protein